VIPDAGAWAWAQKQVSYADALPRAAEGSLFSLAGIGVLLWRRQGCGTCGWKEIGEDVANVVRLVVGRRVDRAWFLLSDGEFRSKVELGGIA
jgi:hypothetical protein